MSILLLRPDVKDTKNDQGYLYIIMYMDPIIT